jgi:hypothetical protein
MQIKNMRHRRKPLRKGRRLSTAPAAGLDFLQWLNRALQDERWRAVIRDRLIQAELAEIQF